jgi:hypothetical protein
MRVVGDGRFGAERMVSYELAAAGAARFSGFLCPLMAYAVEKIPFQGEDENLSTIEAFSF